MSVCYPGLMAAVCDICAKKPFFGKRVSTPPADQPSVEPERQRVRALVDGTPRRLHVCTSCIKAGKVTRVG